MNKFDQGQERKKYEGYESCIDPLTVKYRNPRDFIQWREKMVQVIREHIKVYTISTEDIIASINNFPRYVGNIFIQYINNVIFNKSFPSHAADPIAQISQYPSMTIKLADEKVDVEEVIKMVFDDITRRSVTKPVKVNIRPDMYICSDQFGLSTRAKNCILRRVGHDILCSEFAEQFSYHDLIMIRGIGPISIEQIVRGLRELGYLLKPETRTRYSLKVEDED